MTGVVDHIHFKGGSKTVCTSAVLAAFGIHPGSYHYSGQHQQRAQILRRKGWAVRSRASRVKGCSTIGQLRKRIQSKAGTWGDPKGTRYMVRVTYSGTNHAMLLDATGGTVVDTAPRKRDRRRILSVHAVFRNV